MQRVAFEAQQSSSKTFSAYMQHKFGDIDAAQIKIAGIFKSSQKLAFTGLIVGIFFAAFIGVYLRRSFSIPICKLLSAAEKLSSGNPDFKVAADRANEFERLALAFDKMRKELKRRIQKEQKAAQKAMTAARAKKAKSVEIVHSNTKLKKEIIERKQVEQALSDTQQRAEMANQAKSVFLANMSHELRTPLNHIIGFGELVVDQHFGELNEMQIEYIDDILYSSKHLLSIINDILDLSKVEAGKLKLELSQVNLQTLLSNSLTMVKEKSLQQGIKLNTAINGIPAWVQMDERKMKQIVYNLLSNAVKFTPDNGEITLGARTIMDVARRDSGGNNSDEMKSLKNSSQDIKSTAQNGYEWIEISVSDNGLGIAPKDQERIFKEFEQAENTTFSPSKGTGLGLPLTQKFVELHGGYIWVESEGLNRGSTFRFVIPANIPKAEG
jgi:signal transduction histidine kinase